MNYGDDLILIPVPAMRDAACEQRYQHSLQRAVWRREMPPGFERPFDSQPFCGISFELDWRTKGARYVQPSVSKTVSDRVESPHSFEGAVSHYGDAAEGRILLDQVLDQAAWILRAGRPTVDLTYFREAAEQLALFRATRRDP